MEKPLADALDRVRLLATAGRFTDLSDGALLDRCATERDDVAFAVLVHRHGAMVYGTCYRILRHPHDAEDACQATFLVLARQASGIRNQTSAASWLHGVARRVSLTLLRERGERRRREDGTPVAEPASAEPTGRTWSEVQVLLDEELGRLPERLRSPLVLCYLEGKTRDEAAAALGLTPGRLHGLLQRGRTLLRERLVKRGVTLGAAFLGAELSSGVSQAFPPTLAVRVVNGAVATLRGQDLVPALASESVVHLSKEVIRAMTHVKREAAVKWAACVLAVCALVGAGLLAAPKSAPDPRPAPAHAPVPKGGELPKGPNRIVYWYEGYLHAMEPTGGRVKRFGNFGYRYGPQGQRLSPDGTCVAALRRDKNDSSTLFLVGIKGKDIFDEDDATDLGVKCDTFTWSPDGTKLVGTRFTADEPGKKPDPKSFVIDVKTKEKTDLKLPAGHVVTDWTRDGKLLTTTVSGTDPARAKVRMHLVNLDGTVHKALAEDTNVMAGRISPDGTRVLCVRIAMREATREEKAAREKDGANLRNHVQHWPTVIDLLIERASGGPVAGFVPETELVVVEVATGKVTRVAGLPRGASVAGGFCWSPDGKRIAYLSYTPAPTRGFDDSLVVCDPDGKNAKVLESKEGNTRWHGGEVHGGLDWR